MSDPLLPPDWSDLAPLLDQVLDAPPDRRPALITELSGGDPDRRAALARMVADCERISPLLDRPASERFSHLADDNQPFVLPAMLGGRYQPGRELGRGGMARVYLARDVKHDRDVAVKVIRPEIAAGLGHDRFLREIEIAARLRHPNIVPLYDSGDADGLLYFVMPFEAGQSLRERLRKGGPLSIPDAVSVLRDVARALAYAHDQGVVHRDVKPDNVMLSGGAAVVTDFGIAKAVTAARTGVAGVTVTQAGSGIGTPAYMAPEQAVGDPGTDHRADLYSFGCLAYEVLSGRPPFDQTSTHELIAAHIGLVPRPVSELRPDVPPALAALIARCLEKLPSARPANAAEILAVLDDGAAPLAAPRRPARRVATLVALAVVAAVSAWALLRNRPAAPGPAGAPVASLVVLPFGNPSGDSTVDRVGDGLADDISMALGRVPGLQMKSRWGALLYRGKLGVDVVEAARRLQADYLVTGVLREDRGRWKLTVYLDRGRDGAELWTSSTQVLAEQQGGVSEEVAASIADVLRREYPSLGSAARLTGSQRTRNPEAYRLYLLGQERLDKRTMSVNESAEHFRAAIRQDSGFARAHAGLAMALALTPYFMAAPAASVDPELQAAARRAIALDSTLAPPHVALGVSHQFANRWADAETEFRRAVALDARDVEARLQYGRMLLFQGRLDEGLAQLQVAREIEPAYGLILGWVSYAFYLQGRMDSARVVSRQALEGNALNFTAVIHGALIHLADGDRDGAVRLMKEAPGPTPLTYYLRAVTGDTAGLRARLDSMARAPRPLLTLHTIEAFSYMGIGDTARAVTALEAATDAGEIWPSLESVHDRIFDRVRPNPRFQALLARVGLTKRR